MSKEYKLGQIVTINGTKCRVIKSDDDCEGCILNNQGEFYSHSKFGCLSLKCSSLERKDDKDVKFEPISEINKNKNKKEMYKVKQSDIKGAIKDFPIEVVQKMVERHIEQDGNANIEFKDKFDVLGYFTWKDTIEGVDFWSEVIDYKNFDLFFERYPKSGHPKLENAEFPLPPEKMRVWIRGNKDRGEEVIKALTDLGAKNNFKHHGWNEYAIFFIDKNNEVDSTLKESTLAAFIANFYKEIILHWKPKDKELVWAWDDWCFFERYLIFYDAKNCCAFYSKDGGRNGCNYDHYAPFEGEYPDWAKEAQKKLED